MKFTKLYHFFIEIKPIVIVGLPPTTPTAIKISLSFLN